MDLKVSQLSIRSFRGIPNNLILDLRPESSSDPGSLLLSGDNGTGKSSIVDAFEFVLQGRMLRKKDLSASNVPSVLSIAREEKCSVSVEFSNGLIKTREILRGKNGKIRFDKNPDSNFAVSPFILRRSDILQFWDAPEHQRQLIFSDYLRDPKIESEAWSSTQKEEIDKLNQAKRDTKRKRVRLTENLANLLNLNRNQIPLDPKQFDRFVRNKYYNGLTATARRYEGWKLRKQHRIPRQEKMLITGIRECTNQITTLDGKIRKVKGKSSLQLKSLLNVLRGANNTVTNAFKEISPSSAFVERIEFVYGKVTEVSLSLNVYLTNGKVLSPSQIFSEANLDLLAMLVFLAVAKESAQRGQAKFLVLDDVLQSVDASIRLAMTEYIVREFNDWQLVFTLHERFWQEQLRTILRRHNHQFIEHEIVRWSFDTGPIIVSARRDVDTLLRDAIDRGEVSNICSQSGLLLERICDVLSYAIPLQVPRNKDNKYTIGVLWPRLYQYFKKTTSNTKAQDVERWLHLRNLVGAHFNDWAQNVTLQEAQSFGEAVLRLLDDTYCDKCNRWVNRKWANKTNTNKCKLSCFCQKTRIIIDEK